MNGNEAAFLRNSEISAYAVVEGIFSEKNIVNLGFIRKIHNEDFIDVELDYLSPDGSEQVIPDVRLLHFGTSVCRLIAEPSEGDRVLVLTPRDFVAEMDYGHKADYSEGGYIRYSETNSCAVLVCPEGGDGPVAVVKAGQDGTLEVATEGDVSVSAKGDVKVDSTDGTVVLDGDSYGGLCKTKELKTQLDKATARIDGIIDALKNSATGSQDGGATYKTNIALALARLADKEDYSDIESETVLHGDGPSES